MKRILLGSLLSCMLISQVSCDASQKPFAKTGAALAGMVLGFAVPQFIAENTNAPLHMMHCAGKYGFAEKISLKNHIDAMRATWLASSIAITLGSLITLSLTENDVLFSGAACTAISGALSAMDICMDRQAGDIPLNVQKIMRIIESGDLEETTKLLTDTSREILTTKHGAEDDCDAFVYDVSYGYHLFAHARLAAYRIQDLLLREAMLEIVYTKEHEYKVAARDRKN